MPSRYYPIFLTLQGVPCLVVGGGGVALRKVEGLLKAGASVTVIAPDVSRELEALAHGKGVPIIKRSYVPGDMERARLVISATDDPSVNEVVWREAQERGILINVVDEPGRCNFIAPSIIRRGDVTIAISTGGKSPALAKRMRLDLERAIGPEYEVLLNWLGELRPTVKGALDQKTREALWNRVVYSDVLDLLREGHQEQARARFDELVGALLRGIPL